MQGKLIAIAFFFVVCLAQIDFAQRLPPEIKNYLDKNYKGWKMPQHECGDSKSLGFVSGDFDGDRKKDFAVKFIRGNKAYILAFLRRVNIYKPFTLHNYTPDEATYSNLGIWKKGELFESENKSFRLKYDAPSDYRCESDVGGIHYFKNGKFVGY